MSPTIFFFLSDIFGKGRGWIFDFTMHGFLRGWMAGRIRSLRYAILGGGIFGIVSAKLTQVTWF